MVDLPNYSHYTAIIITKTALIYAPQLQPTECHWSKWSKRETEKLRQFNTQISLVLIAYGRLCTKLWVHDKGAILARIFECFLIYMHDNLDMCILDTVCVIVQFVSVSGAH